MTTNTSKQTEYLQSKDLTSIIIRKTTRERLRKVGHKMQKYDDIILELLQLWEQKKRNE